MNEILVKGYSSFILDDKILICVYRLSDSENTRTINEVWDKFEFPKQKIETRSGWEFKGDGYCND